MVNQDQTGLWTPNSAGKQKHTHTHTDRHQSFREMNEALPDLQRTSYLIKRRKSYSKRHERGEEGGEKSQGGGIAYAKAIKTGDPDPV